MENIREQEILMNEQMIKPIKITIKINERTSIPLEVTQTDTLLEIKQFLSDSSEMFIFTSFHLEKNDQPLNEYVEIRQLELADGDVLKIKIDTYEEKSAKMHVKKVQELINTPSLITTYFTAHSGPLSGNMMRGPSSGEPQRDLKESLKSNETLIQNNNEKPAKEKTRNHLSLNESFSPNLKNYLSCYQRTHKQDIQKVTLLHYVNFSGFNPPPPIRKLRGDFFYLYFRNLEGTDFHVTATAAGFFINNSNYKFFDPEPNPHYPQLYINLMDLFKDISPLFKQNYNSLLQTDALCELDDIPVMSIFKNNNWLGSEKECKLSTHEWNLNRCENSLLNLYGLDPTVIRDWNDELQMCRDLPKGDFMQRLNRDKAIIKIHCDFIEAAIEGSKAVIEKNIQPLNPMDQKYQQVYVYNHIFFSYALETSDTFRQELGPDASPTISTSNCDLRNLNLLHKFDIPGLHLLNTALIDYKGYRVIAQSIIPGILNSEHNLCTKYGSIDDGKTIHYNLEFHELMKKVCEKLSIDDSVKFLNEEKEEVTLAGSIEVKGIEGSDRRKYILDLMRLTPRDFNYKTVGDENLCCVVRPELISNFLMMKSIEIASEKIKKEYEKEDAEDEEEERQGGDPAKRKEKKQNKNINRMLKLQEYLMNQKEPAPKYQFNVNLETKANYLVTEKTKEQIKDLENLGEFILKNTIPNLIQDLINGDTTRLGDSRTIEEVFHSHGVNMRYLGKVIQAIDLKEHTHFRYILERIIVAKCLKHVFRELMRESNTQLLAHIIAHGLNCVFAPKQLKQALDKKEIKFEVPQTLSLKVKAESAGAQESKTKNKKKKKNKPKKEEQESIKERPPTATDNSSMTVVTSVPNKAIDTDKLPEVLYLTPKDIWAKIVHISKKRYDYPLPENYAFWDGFDLKFNKMALLRDVCQSTGIQVECTQFNIFDTPEDQQRDPRNGSLSYKSLPFSFNNITSVTPVVKHLDVSSEDVRVNMDIGHKLIREGKLNEALDCFNTAVQFLFNLFGPIHKDLALCYSKIASIHYKLGEIEQAVIFQKQAVKTFEKFYGLDHSTTAHAISNLGLFYFGLKNFDKAFKHIIRSLFLINLIGGEAHPESFLTFMNLSVMYQECERFQPALSCLFEALDRTVSIYGKNHLKVSNCYQAIASCHFEMEDVKKAIEYQEKSINILKEHLKPDDVRLQEATLYLSKYKKNLNDKQKVQNSRQAVEGGKPRNFGQNKPLNKNPIREENKKPHPEDVVSKEREILKAKLRMAKLNAKGTKFRGNPNLDWSRFLMNQSQMYFQDQAQMDAFLKAQEAESVKK